MSLAVTNEQHTPAPYTVCLLFHSPKISRGHCCGWGRSWASWGQLLFCWRKQISCDTRHLAWCFALLHPQTGPGKTGDSFVPPTAEGCSSGVKVVSQTNWSIK
jgi:hypothetical protein